MISSSNLLFSEVFFKESWTVSAEKTVFFSIMPVNNKIVRTKFLTFNLNLNIIFVYEANNACQN